MAFSEPPQPHSYPSWDARLNVGLEDAKGSKPNRVQSRVYFEATFKNRLFCWVSELFVKDTPSASMVFSLIKSVSTASW